MVRLLILSINCYFWMLSLWYLSHQCFINNIVCFQGSGAHAKRRNLCKDSCKFIKHLHLEGKFRLVVPQVIVTNFQDREEYKVWGPYWGNISPRSWQYRWSAVMSVEKRHRGPIFWWNTRFTNMIVWLKQNC